MQLHPGFKWKSRFLLWFSGAFLLVPLLIFTLIFAANTASPGAALLTVFFIYIIVWPIITEVFVQLSYRSWKYELTKTGVNIERGILSKRYSSIPYSKVQNVDVRRGIFARMLGYSEVYIQTAGYSSPRVQSEGYLPAIGDAERDIIMKRMKS